MNITSGIFTAPKSGIYSFSFTGLKDWQANPLSVLLYHNTNWITTAYGAGAAGYLTADLSSILSLKFGDQIRLVLGYGQLFDGDAHYTNFIGMLLQEEML
jgi:C1q domain